MWGLCHGIKQMTSDITVKAPLKTFLCKPGSMAQWAVGDGVAPEPPAMFCFCSESSQPRAGPFPALLAVSLGLRQWLCKRHQRHFLDHGSFFHFGFCFHVWFPMNVAFCWRTACILRGTLLYLPNISHLQHIIEILGSLCVQKQLPNTFRDHISNRTWSHFT